jgi:hypothetical protein
MVWGRSCCGASAGAVSELTRGATHGPSVPVFARPCRWRPAGSAGGSLAWSGAISESARLPCTMTGLKRILLSWSPTRGLQTSTRASTQARADVRACGRRRSGANVPCHARPQTRAPRRHASGRAKTSRPETPPLRPWPIAASRGDARPPARLAVGRAHLVAAQTPTRPRPVAKPRPLRRARPPAGLVRPSAAARPQRCPRPPAASQRGPHPAHPSHGLPRSRAAAPALGALGPHQRRPAAGYP